MYEVSDSCKNLRTPLNESLNASRISIAWRRKGNVRPRKKKNARDTCFDSCLSRRKKLIISNRRSKSLHSCKLRLLFLWLLLLLLWWCLLNWHCLSQELSKRGSQGQNNTLCILNTISGSDCQKRLIRRNQFSCRWIEKNATNLICSIWGNKWGENLWDIGGIIESNAWCP